VADTFAYCLLRNHSHLLVRIKTIEEQKDTLRIYPKIQRRRLPRAWPALDRPRRRFSAFLSEIAGHRASGPASNLRMTALKRGQSRENGYRMLCARFARTQHTSLSLAEKTFFQRSHG
jgi:hypothetical protein